MRSKHTINSLDSSKSTKSIRLVHKQYQKQPNTQRSTNRTFQFFPKESPRVITKMQVQQIKKSLVSEQQALKRYSQKLLKKKEQGKTTRKPISISKLAFDASETQPNARSRYNTSVSQQMHDGIKKKRRKGQKRSPIISKLKQLNSTIKSFAQTARGALQKRIKQRIQTPPKKIINNNKQISKTTLKQYFNELDSILDLQELSFSFCRKIEPQKQQICNYLQRLKKMNFDFCGGCEIFGKIVSSWDEISSNSRQKFTDSLRYKSYLGKTSQIQPIDTTYISMRELLGLHFSISQPQVHPLFTKSHKQRQKQSQTALSQKQKLYIQYNRQSLNKTKYQQLQIQSASKQKMKKIIQIDKFCHQFQIREEMIRQYLKLKKQRNIEELVAKDYQSSTNKKLKNNGKSITKDFFTRTYNCSLDLVDDSEELPSTYRRKSPQFSASFRTQELRDTQKYGRTEIQDQYIDKQRSREKLSSEKSKNKIKSGKKVLKY